MTPLMLELGKKKTNNQHLNESSPLIYLNWNSYNLKAVFKNAAYCRLSVLVRKKVQAQENSNWAPAISSPLKQFLLYLVLSSLVFLLFLTSYSSVLNFHATAFLMSYKKCYRMCSYLTTYNLFDICVTEILDLCIQSVSFKWTSLILRLRRKLWVL